MEMQTGVDILPKISIIDRPSDMMILYPNFSFKVGHSGNFKIFYNLFLANTGFEKILGTFHINTLKIFMPLLRRVFCRDVFYVKKL